MEKVYFGFSRYDLEEDNYDNKVFSSFKNHNFPTRDIEYFFNISDESKLWMNELKDRLKKEDLDATIEFVLENKQKVLKIIINK